MRTWRFTLLLATASLLAAGVAGCATPPPASNPQALAYYKQTNDPLEPTNRVFYAINNGIYAVIFKPLAVGYTYAVPEVVRNHVHDALANLNSPVILANDVLEGKPHRAGDTLMRFVINSTAGVGGFFDVADGLGYPSHDADFGMTLAVWGVGPGPFLYLPVLGPSDPRDAFGYGADIAMDPFTWVGSGGVTDDLYYTRYGMTVVDTYSRVGPDLDKVKAQALDPYATFRSLYRQHRESQIDAVRNDNQATTPDWNKSTPAQ